MIFSYEKSVLVAGPLLTNAITHLSAVLAGAIGSTGPLGAIPDSRCTQMNLAI
jgi:hypothetical protein